MPSFSYTVNGELNSFGAPVHDVVRRLADLAVRIALAHGPRPRQRFRAGGSDAVHAAQGEPPDAGALVSGHQSPMESANTARSCRWNGDDLPRATVRPPRASSTWRSKWGGGGKNSSPREILFPNLILAIELHTAVFRNDRGTLMTPCTREGVETGRTVSCVRHMFWTLKENFSSLPLYLTWNT